MRFCKSSAFNSPHDARFTIHVPVSGLSGLSGLLWTSVSSLRVIPDWRLGYGLDECHAKRKDEAVDKLE